MSTYNIIAPVSAYASKYNYVTDANTAAAWEKWKQHVKNAAKLSNIPEAIVFAFLMVESKGIKASADANPSTPGLMQWNPNYAYEVLEKEKNNGRMSVAEEDFLKTKGLNFVKVGTKFQISGTPIVLKPNVNVPGTNWRTIKKETAIDPWLNIYVGSVYLGQYMDEDWAKEAGQTRLDRIVARYNVGQGSLKYTKGKTTAQILADASTPAVTKKYIKEIIGLNGTMDAAIKLGLSTQAPNT